MKNYLTHLFNSSVCRHLQRLAIVCFCLSYATIASATWKARITAKADITVDATGKGSVYVNQKNELSANDDEEDTYTSADLKKNSANDHTKAFFWHAVPNTNSNSAFYGWYENPGADGSVVAENPYECPITVQQSNPTVEKTFYAHFKPIISINSQMWDTVSIKIKKAETLSRKVLLDLYKATNFEIEERGDTNNKISCLVVNAGGNEISAPETGSCYLEVILDSDANADDSATYILTADNGGSATLHVSVDATETNVTFCSNKYLSYTVEYQGGGGAAEVNAKDAPNYKKLASEDLILKVATHTDYRFYRWKITRPGNSKPEYIYNYSKNSNDYSTTYKAQNGDTIALEHIETNYARFRVDDGATSMYYDNLQVAADAAERASTKIVYVHQNGNVLADTYTIPAGVTLLVQRGGDEVCVIGALRGEDFYDFNNGENGQDKVGNGWEANNSGRKITLDKSTTIKVFGNICVHSKPLSNQAYIGMPYSPGFITMGDSCLIELENGSKLMAYGFITHEQQLKQQQEGKSITSKIIAKSGSEVYEVFQIRDWAGGEKVLNMVNYTSSLLGYKEYNEHGVFPISQYYVQNIETCLRVEQGANMFLSTHIAVSGSGGFPITEKFISSGSDGFFRMKSNAVVEKYYDHSKDRLHINLLSKDEQPAIAELGNIRFQYSEGSLIKVTADINSSEFVLPLNMNTSISLDNVLVTNLYDVAMLAGSSLTINDDAELTLNGDLFIYDYAEHPQEQSGGGNTWGFYRPSHPVRRRNPVVVTTRGYKTYNDAVGNDVDPERDAKIVVNGKIINTATGSLFTTAGGAKITSTNRGQISFDNVDFTRDKYTTTDPNTYQKNHDTGKDVAISITSAKLYNEGKKGTGKQYTETNGENETYYYNKEQQMWETTVQIAHDTTTFTDPNPFVFKIPNEDEPVTEDGVITVAFTAAKEMSFSVEIVGSSNFKLEDWNLQGERLIIPISYTQSNKHGNDTAIIKITENNEQVVVPDFEIHAIEDYTPIFDVNVPSFTKQLCDQDSIPTETLSITPGNNGNNVTSLLGRSDSLLWLCQIVGNDFYFPMSDGGRANTIYDISNARIAFNPTSAGEKSDTLIVTATSYFVEDGDAPLVGRDTIVLSGTAILCNNPLAFNPNIAQLFEGEENVTLLANTGSGAAIPIDAITYDPDYIQLSGSGTDYKITALKATDDGQPTTITINTQDAANGYNTLPSPIHIDITILSAVTWHWDVLYYGGTHTNPLTVDHLITDGVLKIADSNSEDIKNLLTFEDISSDGEPYKYTLTIGENVIAEDTVIFNFTSDDHNLDYDFPAILSDLRLLTACVSDTASYTALNWNTDSTFFSVVEENGDSVGVVTFKSRVGKPSSWTMQFCGVPSKVIFTPSGENQWQVLQGPTSDDMTLVESRTYTSGNKVELLLQPTSRFVKFVYLDDFESNKNTGTLRNICVYKLTIEANASVVYLPVKTNDAIDLENDTIDLVIKHSTESLTLDEVPSGITCNQDDAQLGELGYYQTTFKLSATKTGTYTITAREGEDSTSIQVIAFDYPMGLPIITDDWIDNDSTEEKNTKNYYHFYVEKSEYAHWGDDPNQPYIVFENTNYSGIRRSVTFAFEGAPSVIKFNYVDGSNIVDPNEWTVREYNEKGVWETTTTNRIVNGGEYNFVQELKHTTRKVELSHIGRFYGESKISNLIIEGYPKTIITPDSLNLNNSSDSSHISEFTITAINLQDIQIKVDNPSFLLEYTYQDATGDTVVSTANDSTIVLTESECPAALGTNKVGDIVIKVTWDKSASVSHGIVSITNKNATPNDDPLLGTVKLIGSKGYINSTNTNTGIWTGKNPRYTLRGDGSTFEPYTHHHVDVKNAFANDKALFDYMIIYGETTTKDGSNIIFEPDAKSGSNALTPYYIYQREGDAYKLVQIVENANSPYKAFSVIELEEFSNSVSAYITGFCPYATTGYTDQDEGVWYFRGYAGTRIDLYLDSCHIYSRNKSKWGEKYGKNDTEASTFAAGGVEGSGAVFVFENKIKDYENAASASALKVAIHTINHNVVKSNYGAYLNVLGGMDGRLLVAQVSAAVQVRLGCLVDGTNKIYDYDYKLAKTIIDFDDKWPTDLNDTTKFIRTNGFLSLQKQQNYAPSIDIGNANTVVNFRGGRVELQNAAIQSPNYKTTLAISHRTGIMGNIDDFRFAYGLGTDDVGGTVHFYDGTTTVKEMWIDEVYKEFYLIDKNADGTEVTRNNSGKTQYRTTCLRTPAQTFVYGGSHCMLRACKYVTSSGGAPTDGHNKLGRYEYTLQLEKSDEIETPDSIKTNGLAQVNNFPKDSTELANYYDEKQYDYGLESVSPVNNKLHFWIPDVDSTYNVKVENDKELLTWVACMTEIAGGGFGIEAMVGGDVVVDDDDSIKNVLYCQLDDYIYNVISANEIRDGEINYTYKAPAEDPSKQLEERYQRIGLTGVSKYKQHSILRESDYLVTNKLYYITTAKADKWMNFTMPFDVAKVWIVEAFDESQIEAQLDKFKAEDDSLSLIGKLDKEASGYLSPLERTKMWQANHNADFAAFFAMAMAIGQFGKDFDAIKDSYMEWVQYQDSTTDKRGMYELQHYDGSAFSFFTANYYLYKNYGDWEMNDNGTPDNDEDDRFDTKWDFVPAVEEGDTLMYKGESYSMLFPYCTGCDVEKDDDGNVILDDEGLPTSVERDYWDYWTGKFLIFESTQAEDGKPHVIRGTDYTAPTQVSDSWIFKGMEDQIGRAMLTGNSTFSVLPVDQYDRGIKSQLYTYSDTRWDENFYLADDGELLVPTATFLMMDYHKPVRGITRSGRIITDSSDDQGNGNQGTTTGGHMPTVGGGHDILITGVTGGINVAVASPQQVLVVSATGTVLYSGYVNDNVDVPLPLTGIYVVKGENEVQKIFY